MINYLLLIQPTCVMIRKPASTRIFITFPVPLGTDFKKHMMFVGDAINIFCVSTFRIAHQVSVKEQHMQGQ